MNSQRQILARHLKWLADGELCWIGIRPGHKQAMVELPQVLAIENQGLQGDHRCQKTPGSGRQVTLISTEYIQQIEHFTGIDAIHPARLRRNLLVSNINLMAIRHQRFSIGEALFEATALCHPCSRMEKELGAGAVAAMLGHGGLCAKIIKTGWIKKHDILHVILDD
ncbi:MAG: sulfurase [Pseudomonadales bacterium]|nr:sulfurase [Pseudomonadales bacterium]